MGIRNFLKGCYLEDLEFLRISETLKHKKLREAF
jgi:hypothetical protein